MARIQKIALLPLLLLLCILSIDSSAQQTPPTPGVIRINVNLVQVDAVVTGSGGKPVTNLTAEDFELEQDGKLQKINVKSVKDP